MHSSICISVLFLVGYFCFCNLKFDSDIVSQEKGTDTSAKSTPHLTTRPNGPLYALPMIPMDNDDVIPYEGLVKTCIREEFTVFQYKNYSWAETLS